MFDNFGSAKFTNEWEYRQAQQRGETSGSSGFYGSDSGILSPGYHDLTIAYVRDTLRRPFLVEFYAPWCVHCQHLAPGIKKLAILLEDKIAIGAINCEQKPRLCQQEQITGYPTLRLLLPAGHSEQYDGPLEYDAVHDWIDSIIDSPLHEVTTANMASLLRNSPHVWLLTYGSPYCGPCQQVKRDVRAVAAALKTHGVRVATIDCAAQENICRRHSVPYWPYLRVLPPHSSDVATASVAVEVDVQRMPPAAIALHVTKAVLQAVLPVQQEDTDMDAEDHSGWGSEL